MRFLHYGEMHSVTRITGPQHNYLAVTFATEGQSPEPQVVELPPQGGCEHRPLDRAKILASVLAGVAEGNREYGSDFVVASIQFVANDTGPEKVYQYMAKLLVEETLRHQSEQHANFERLMAKGRSG